MLRIIAGKNGERAVSYFTNSLSQSDYYLEQQKVKSEWLGLGAERMGLSGVVEPQQFEALAQNRHPLTSEKLTPRDGAHRRVGFDMNFHCPKSVSLAFALTEDPAILDAFQKAVDQTMWEAQHLAHTLVRRDGSKSKRLTGNLVWGRFTHLTARPVDGIPDPHLHAHCYVFNTTWDDVEARWKALELNVVHQCAPKLERNFHEQLVANLQAAGYPASLLEKYSELNLFSEQTLASVSRRTAEIDAAAVTRGIEDAKVKDRLGRLTRKAKNTSLSWEELRSVWAAWVPPAERDAVFRAMKESREQQHEPKGATREAEPQAPAKVGPLPLHVKDEEAAIEWSLDKLMSRKRVASGTRIVTEAYLESGKRLNWEKLWLAFKRRKDVLRSLGVDGWTATRTDTAVSEKLILDYVAATRDNQRPIGFELKPVTVKELRPDELRALGHAVTDSCGIAVLTGSGSVQNRALLTELATQCTQQHMGITIVCPSRAAADALAKRSPKQKPRGLGRLKSIRDIQKTIDVVKDAIHQKLLPGVEGVQSVAEFLREGQGLVSEPWRHRGHVVVLDDAASVSLSTFYAVIEKCRKANAKLVATGERAGEAFAGAGNVIELLTSHGGLEEACIERRQDRISATLESGLKSWRKDKSLDALVRGDHVVKEPRSRGMTTISQWFGAEERKNRQLSPKRRKSVVVVASTEMEREELTAKIRQELHRIKLLGSRKRMLVVMEPLNMSDSEKADAKQYRSGLFVRFDRSVKGFRAGEVVQVLGQSRLGGVMVTSRTKKLPRHLPLERSECFSVMAKSTLAVRPGEQVQFIASGFSKDGKHRIEAGEKHRVKSFTRRGDLKLENGWVVSKDFGFLKYGYVTPPAAAAKGRRADLVLASGYAGWSTQELFIKTMESGRNVAYFTPSVVSLERAIRNENVAGLGSDVVRDLVQAEQRKSRARQQEQDDGIERNAAT